MRYIDVNWLLASDNEPYRLVSEIGPDQYETRKLEFFINGEIGYASPSIQTRDTKLGDVEVPQLDEINSQSEFEAKSISRQQFEILWKSYTS